METIVDEQEGVPFNPDDWEPCSDNEEPANEGDIKENKKKNDDDGESTDDEPA